MDTGEQQLYNGAMPGFTAPQQQQVQAHEIDTRQAARAAGDALDEFVRIGNLYQQLKEDKDEVRVSMDRATEYETRRMMPRGAKGSFFNTDGSLNETEINLFNMKYADRLNKTRRIRFSGEAALKEAETRYKTNEDWQAETRSQLYDDMIKDARTEWRSRMSAFEENGDYQAMDNMLSMVHGMHLIDDDELADARSRTVATQRKVGVRNLMQQARTTSRPSAGGTLGDRSKALKRNVKFNNNF